MRHASALLSAALLLPLALTAGEIGRDFRYEVPAAGIRLVDVDLSIAEVRVGNTASGQVELSGSIRQRFEGRDEEEWARDIVASSQVVLEAAGGVATIRRSAGPSSRSWKAKRSPAQVRATILVPPGMAVAIEQSIGEIEIDGTFGDLDVQLNIGEIDVRTPKKNIRRLSASASIGDVRADLGDRIISKEGIMAGETLYENEGGRHTLAVRTRIGEIEIKLTR